MGTRRVNWYQQGNAERIDWRPSPQAKASPPRYKASSPTLITYSEADEQAPMNDKGSQHGPNDVSSPHSAEVLDSVVSVAHKTQEVTANSNRHRQSFFAPVVGVSWY